MYRALGEIYSEIEEEDDIYQERDTNMPPLGTRVKRGRDWKWGDQDINGPGTVIGHLRQGTKMNINMLQEYDFIVYVHVSTGGCFFSGEGCTLGMIQCEIL